jgi:hypothetical protein
MQSTIKWKDGTLKTNNLRIQITNSHIYAKGEWVMHVREFGWNTKRLGLPSNASEEEAQSAAIHQVRSHLIAMKDELNGL